MCSAHTHTHPRALKHTNTHQHTHTRTHAHSLRAPCRAKYRRGEGRIGSQLAYFKRHYIQNECELGTMKTQKCKYTLFGSINDLRVRKGGKNLHILARPSIIDIIGRAYVTAHVVCPSVWPLCGPVPLKTLRLIHFRCKYRLCVFPL